MFKGHFASGAITGTGAAINVPLGFTPTYVEIQNITSRDELKWFKTMAAASGVKRVAAGTGSLITANGVSPYVGTGEISPGFTIGADADINVAAELLFYIAFGQD